MTYIISPVIFARAIRVQIINSTIKIGLLFSAYINDSLAKLSNYKMASMPSNVEQILQTGKRILTVKFMCFY